jgi:hypothetical protein
MIKSPFKFLDSYTLEDRAILFGFNQENNKCSKYGSRLHNCTVIGNNIYHENLKLYFNIS